MTLSMGCLHMMVVGGEYWAKIGESGEKTHLERILCFFSFFFFFIFKIYIIVLGLPNIKMNPPQVYNAVCCAQSLSRVPLFCDPMDYSPQHSSVH